MGLLATVAAPLDRLLQDLPLYQTVLLGFVALLLLSVVLNVTRQLLFKDRNAPPEVFSWFPMIGSTYVVLCATLTLTLWSCSMQQMLTHRLL